VVAPAAGRFHQGEPAKLGDQMLIEREMAGRTRKPRDEIVFSDWGQLAEL